MVRVICKGWSTFKLIYPFLVMIGIDSAHCTKLFVILHGALSLSLIEGSMMLLVPSASRPFSTGSFRSLPNDIKSFV